MGDFQQLAAAWSEWGPIGGLSGVRVSTECPDCLVLFFSDDYEFHLKKNYDWWVVDTVDDRGSRSPGLAQLSNFSLAEKYLIWNWITAARSDLASGALGSDLYKLGYAPGVMVSEMDFGRDEVCADGECAILMTGTSTIFSHIMTRSLDEIMAVAKGGQQ
jgi:hypothetical protein